MEYSVPDLIISTELIERIQFSVSSRNAEAKLGECAAHIFAAPYSDNPHDINWQYVSSGVACLLRNRELTKNGRKYMWSMSMCLYNASYGVLVWKAKLLPNCDYTAVADNFHVFALAEVNVLIGIMFSNKEKACELCTTYTKWHQERIRDDGKKGFVSSASAQGSEPIRFRKEMISKPCNFQHIQGTQAIDECMDIEKIKADIVAALFGLGTKAGRSEADGEGGQKSPQKSKKKKKEVAKQRLEFKEITLPQTQSSPPPVGSPTISGSNLPPPDMVTGGFDQSDEPETVWPSNDAPPTTTTTDPSAAAISGQYDLQMANGYQDNTQQQQQQLVADPMEQLLSNYGGEPPLTSSSQQRAVPESPPNFQNPASPSFQEFSATSQGSYSYSMEPPRLEMNLEKEFADSVLFKSSIMTAN